MKFWWPLFLAIKFTFLFLNLAEIHISIPKCNEGGGGSTGLGNIPKKKLTASLKRIFNRRTICDKVPPMTTVSEKGCVWRSLVRRWYEGRLETVHESLREQGIQDFNNFCWIFVHLIVFQIYSSTTLHLESIRGLHLFLLQTDWHLVWTLEQGNSSSFLYGWKNIIGIKW